MNTPHLIQIADYKANLHTFIAAKPNSTHPNDSFLFTVVHHSNSVGCLFVVHTFNLQDGGYYNGYYFDTLEEALTFFSNK